MLIVLGSILVALLLSDSEGARCGEDMLTDEELAPVIPASLKEQLRRSTGVEAVRLVEKGQFHFVPHGQPVTLERSAAERLLRLLDAPEAFPRSYLMCIMTPGVEYRFRTDDGFLRVRVCFECDLLSFSDEEDRDLAPVVSFCRSRRELLALTKEVFPKDREIRKLKADR